MDLGYVFIALLTGFVVLAFAVVGSNVAFYRRLKRYERRTWSRIGAPRLINLNAGNFALVRTFLREGGHKALKDRTAVQLGELVKRLDTILLAYIFLTVAIVGCIAAFVDP